MNHLQGRGCRTDRELALLRTTSDLTPSQIKRLAKPTVKHEQDFNPEPLCRHSEVPAIEGHYRIRWAVDRCFEHARTQASSHKIFQQLRVLIQKSEKIDNRWQRGRF